MSEAEHMANGDVLANHADEVEFERHGAVANVRPAPETVHDERINVVYVVESDHE